MFQTFSASQQKEILKMQQENKQSRKYCLTVFKDGIYQEISDAEFEEFKKMCPMVAQIIEEPSLMTNITMPDQELQDSPLYDNWEKAAKRLMSSLWRSNSAQIFHNPVDPDRLGIPDYFEVVQDPIDFGTIKQRLNHSYYFTMREVIEDIQRCFDNCLLYNGEDSPAGQRCLTVMGEFKKLFTQLNIKFYIDLIPLDAEL